MNILHYPPAGFERIQRAFAMARLVPSTHSYQLRLGLVCDGVLFATGELQGYRQVRFFCDHLRAAGWQEHLLGDEGEMYDCDLLFSVPAQEEAQRGDPSFIRRPAVNRWPTPG